MEMCGALPVKDAVLHHALFSRSVPLKALLIDRRVLSMVVRMHLHITGANVGLITFVLYAVIMRLLSVVLTVAELNGAVVR